MNSFQTIAQPKKTLVARGFDPDRLSPAIRYLEPDHFYPFVKSGLRPFAIGPPLFAELEWTVGGGHVDLILRQAMAENHACAARMKFRGYDEDTMGSDRLQTAARIIDFREGGRSKDWANRHPIPFASRLYVPPADVHEELVIDQTSSLSVQKDVRREAFV
jgi:hypothetical protein